MASSRCSRTSGPGSSVRGPAAPAPAAPLAPELNAKFVDMPAADLIAYLKGNHRSSDFVDAALVFKSRERRLAEAEDLLRTADELRQKLQEEISDCDLKILQAAERERLLREEIAALQRRAAADAEARAQHGSEVGAPDIPDAGAGTGVVSDTGVPARGTKRSRGGGAVPEPVPVRRKQQRPKHYTALRMRAEPPGPPAGSSRATRGRR